MVFFEPSAAEAVVSFARRRGDKLLYRYRNLNGIAVHAADGQVRAVAAYGQLAGVLAVLPDGCAYPAH
ncbi:hypothetical protein V6667_03650 [Neisseria leonii]|uniref:Uncharacterized protein n=1 Tax=Neisseria leonii TaxID=2995413 RepID=A0A9X4E090_9NEIS|nr:hypothetical protein [Neisseria sp. 51.81]MDD9327052.1 hypothetical protein [Neisseria sp. 51.81]